MLCETTCGWPAEMLKLSGEKSSDDVPERKVARDWLASKGFIANP